MTMHTVEIDQSIKIEDAGDTVIAFSDGFSGAIVIPHRAKQAAIRVLLARSKRRKVYHLVFAAGVYLLLKGSLDRVEEVVIDTEYAGYAADIKAFLLRRIWEDYPGFRPEQIVVRAVGKRSPAHYKAEAVRKGRDRGYRKVTQRELLEALR